MSGKVHFQFADGIMEGKAFVFDEHDTFIFGRAADCHARLPGDDTLVSPTATQSASAAISPHGES